MRVYLIIEDTLRADFAKPLEDLFNIVCKNHYAGYNWTIPSLGEILTGYHNNGLIWEWGDNFRKDEEEIIRELTEKLKYPTIAEYLNCKTFASMGGGFVNARYGFSRGFDNFEVAPFGFMNYENDPIDEGFLLYHQYYIHDYYTDISDWYMSKFKEDNFKGVSDIVLEKTINAYKQRILVYKGYLKKFINNHRKDIIILTGDHGEGFGENGCWHHGPWAGEHKAVLNIPLLIYNPNYSKTIIKEKTNNIDIVPTILDLFNIKKALPGRNLWTLINTKD